MTSRSTYEVWDEAKKCSSSETWTKWYVANRKKKRLPTFDFRKCSYMPAARHKVRHQEFRIGPSNLALDAHGQTINKTFQGDSRWSALARSLRGSH